MRSKAKFISVIGLFLVMMAVVVFFITDELIGDKAAVENSSVQSGVNEKYYMSPLSFSEIILNKEDIPVNIPMSYLDEAFGHVPYSSVDRDFSEELTKEPETEDVPEVTETETIDEKIETEEQPQESEITETPEDTTTTEVVETTETKEYVDPYNNIFIVNDGLIKEYLNVRDVPGGSIVGVLFPGFGGNVISYENGWAHIVSGDVIGYVDRNYIITGNDAVVLSEANVYAVVTSDTLSLRKKPVLDGEIMDYLKKGESYKVLSIEDGWIRVNNSDMNGYVAAEYVMLSLDVNKAVPTPTEFWNALTAPQVEPETPAETAPVATQPAPTQPVPAPTQPAPAPTQPVPAPTQPAPAPTQPVPAPTQPAPTPTEPVAIPEVAPSTPSQDLTADEQIAQRIAAYAASGNANREQTVLSAADVYLMACVLMIEDGYGTLEGQLAVANVLINRLKAGHWGNTMSGVVYAPNQFWGANNGYLAGIMQQGPRESCIEAALMACAGINNIGDYIYFCSHRNAKYDTYKQWVNVDGNIFYKR